MDYGGKLVSLLDGMTTLIKEWNKNVFGSIFKRDKEIIYRLNGIHDSSLWIY